MRRVIRKRDEKDRRYHKWGAEEKLRIRALADQQISLEGTAKDFGVSASVMFGAINNINRVLQPHQRIKLRKGGTDGM